MTKHKSYTELIKFKTFLDRFEYLKLNGRVGEMVFAFERYLNQHFYQSREWRQLRTQIIVRDKSCDLGMPGHDIYSNVLIHHLNPITIKDIELSKPCIWDPENLICSTLLTHNAIHYGNASALPYVFIERRKGDTCPWTIPVS